MTTILGRVCTICAARGKLVPAVNIATNADNIQWYECADHDHLDHDREFKDGPRIHLESADSFFQRHFGNYRPTPEKVLKDGNKK